MNGVFGVIGLIPEFRKNFALDFCSLVTLLRTKNGLITPLRKKIGEITHYATTKRAHYAITPTYNPPTVRIRDRKISWRGIILEKNSLSPHSSTYTETQTVLEFVKNTHKHISESEYLHINETE